MHDLFYFMEIIVLFIQEEGKVQGVPLKSLFNDPTNVNYIQKE